MAERTPQHEIAMKRVVYEMPGTDAIAARRDVEFRAADGTTLMMDVYHPPHADTDTGAPLVVIVTGYPDAGFERIVGCKFKEMGSTTSWARLIAASGMAAIAYTNREPVADVHALLDHVRENAAALRVDESRIAIWASSGSVPLALSLLMEDSQDALACAVLLYGYTLDLDGATAIADTARAFGFVNPCAAKGVDDLRVNVPLFVARAGRDEMPGLNDAMDRFVRTAIAANRPLWFVNHPSGPHAFDLFDDSAASRNVIRQALSYVRAHLAG